MNSNTCLVALTLCVVSCGAVSAGNLQDRIVKEVVKAKTKGYVNQVQSKLGIKPSTQTSTTGSTATNLINQVKAQLGNKTATPLANPAVPGSTTLTKTIINKVETHFGINSAATGTAAGAVPGVPVTTTTTTTNTVIDKIESRLGINLPGGTNATTTSTLPGTTLPGAVLPGTSLPGVTLPTSTKSAATNAIIDKVESRLGINLPGGSNAATTSPVTTLPGTTATTTTTTTTTTNAIIDKVESRLGINLPGGTNGSTTGSTNTSDLLKQVGSKLGIK
ncbi:MAG: hypothetical protein IPJ49_03450 [Candidatus Obscuribacter sp.]|nr:hypothetical protein [Candidatus Obscuribacter sp.]